MCDPVTIMTTLAIASTATSIISEVQSAKYQKAAIDQQLSTQQAQILTAETAELNERQRTARKEAARVKVAAGQAGLNIGGSVEAMLQDSLMQNQLARERTRLNAESQQQSAVADANSAYSRIEEPTLLGAGLRLASAGAQGYYSGKSMKLSQKNASKGPK